MEQQQGIENRLLDMQLNREVVCLVTYFQGISIGIDNGTLSLGFTRDGKYIYESGNTIVTFPLHKVRCIHTDIPAGTITIHLNARGKK